MRKTFYALLVLFSWASLSAQVISVPVKSATALLPTNLPTLKWTEGTSALGYEVYVTAVLTDTSSAAIPVASTVGTNKRYVSVGSLISDTSYTLDTALVKNTVYYWKVRSKLTGGTFGTWSKFGIFKVGAPAASITDAGNATIVLNHDTLSGISRITYVRGSGKQLLDSAYNDLNKIGLGTSSAASVVGTRDTLVSFDDQSSTQSIYTYKNAGKYGNTGLKTLAITHGATGITVDVSLALATGKTVYFPTAWKAGADYTSDNALFIKNAPAKVAITYPGSATAIGPDSLMVSSFYDSKYNEYFGVKSDSMFAVTDTQKTNLLKQTLKFSNSTGVNKSYLFSYAVRKSRKDYFDTWANKRAIFVTDLVASTDTVKRGNKYVQYESFGAVPDTILYSADGTTFTNPFAFSKDTTAFDSIQYRIPNGAYSATNYVKIITSHGESGVSSAFKASDRRLVVTNPLVTDSFVPDSQLVVWTNNTLAPVTKVELSVDSGATYGGTRTISSALAADTLKYYFNGKSTKCFVRVTTAAGDTGISARFTLQRYISILAPTSSDSFKPDTQLVIWNNYTGVPITTVKVSTDSGRTYGGAVTISGGSTKVTDTLAYLFNGKSTKVFVIAYTAAGDTGKSQMFALERYIAVTKPASGASVTPGATNYVVWNNYTGIAVTKVNISLDSGRTWIGDQTISGGSTAKKDSLAYLFEGTKTTASNVFAQVYSTAGADTGKSARFSISNGGGVFTLTPAFGDPASSVWVPVNFVDGVAGDSLKAFDLLVTFDSSIVHYNDVSYSSGLSGNKWLVMADSSHKSGANGSYIRVSGFKNTTGVGFKSGELLRLQFTINNKQSNIGQVAALTIRNAVLAAAGNNALSLNTSASTNGTIGIYSSVAGNLTYMHSKWDDSYGYPISGDSLMSYTDKAKAANFAVYNVTNGAYRMGSREPNDTIVVAPAASKYMASGLAAITVQDAQLAWRDWFAPLEIRAKIAADVNGDSLINTTDAMAIMETSVDSTYLTRVGLSNWIFVDSTSLDAFESSADSSTAWYTQQQHSITSKLVQQQVHQDFFGVLRGDVNFSANSSEVFTLKKSKAAPVAFSTNEKLLTRPGDTVWVPLNLSLNGGAVGGFNTSMQLDPKVFTYTGEFKNGPTIPVGKNWYITAKADAKGVLRIAGTDFSRTINPIVQDGPALFFKYVVNKTTKLGTTSAIGVGAQAVVDANLKTMGSSTTGGQVEVSRMGSTVVTNYELSQNYPNPFNPSTTIEYALPKDSKVDIVIYNLIGQKVMTLFSGVQTVGYHQVDFNASQMASGIYFYTIRANSLGGDQNFTAVKKMMLLK